MEHSLEDATALPARTPPRFPLRLATAAYGLVAYAISLVCLVALLLFFAELPVPYLPARTPGPVGFAIAIDLGLLLLFGLQHTVMARPTFKAWWTRIVPAPIERSTYLLFSVAVFALILVTWQPLPGFVWQVESALGRSLIWTLYGLGWFVVLLTTFLIDHFELMGLRQTVIGGATGRVLRTPFLYRFVRHPMMLGWIMTFWLKPTMSYGHLLFAIGMTAYILVALRFEERTLCEELGEDYRRYQEKVPMLIPTGRRG